MRRLPLPSAGCTCRLTHRLVGAFHRSPFRALARNERRSFFPTITGGSQVVWKVQRVASREGVLLPDLRDGGYSCTCRFLAHFSILRDYYAWTGNYRPRRRPHSSVWSASQSYVALCSWNTHTHKPKAPHPRLPAAPLRRSYLRGNVTGM